MTLVTHLNKSGSGMASKTACGRNILRTPISTNWEEFKSDAHQCEKCAASRQAELNAKADANKWVPETDPNAWKARDAALIAAKRAN